MPRGCVVADDARTEVVASSERAVGTTVPPTRGGLEAHAGAHVSGRGGVSEVGGDAERLLDRAKHRVVRVEGRVVDGVDAGGDRDRRDVTGGVAVGRVGAILPGL